MMNRVTAVSMFKSLVIFGGKSFVWNNSILAHDLLIFSFSGDH